MRQPAQLPFMSVVVCAYNSERVVARAIESLLAQDYPGERYEIILVDDGSSDRTSAVAGQYPVRLARNEKNQGLAAARNTGLTHMKGDVYEGYAKLSLKKYSPIAARNDDLKVFSGRR